MRRLLLFGMFLVIVMGGISMMQSCLLPIYNAYIDIVVENNAEDTVYVYPATGDDYFSRTKYPDTLLPRNFYLEQGDLTFADVMAHMYVAPHASAALWGKDVEGVFYWERRPYRKCFREIHLDTLSFFFISADTLRRYGYDYVAEHNILLMRYDLSISDMESLDYRIPYPPKDNMKSMKMTAFNTSFPWASQK